ncbi:helix-turn-helix domain-containing protein [Saccharomonospora piscinae]|uniref:helix-turn-helix domain-containing protein n=1 Tax=Saccharomonospora piscinae TaxID=687388 RepID=UPI00207BB2FC|nr:helix-turn-helix transcriptional regulator [Saccharomonospora piscinae]
MVSSLDGVVDAGALLRAWRQRRRFSQQELSNRSRVSTRHLSRVETGRAHPSAEMLLHLAEHLDLPLRDRDRMLLAGGYAPRYGARSRDDALTAVVLEGLRGLLDAHLPYPALILDTYWDLVDANEAAGTLLTGCAPELLEPPVNVVRVCLHPDGISSRIRNLDTWAAHLHRQVNRRAERTHDPRHRELAEEIASYRPCGTSVPHTSGPVLTLELDAGDGVLRFFSASAQLDTATDVALEGLHVETFLPADAETRRRLG